MPMTIERASLADSQEIFSLYRACAKESPYCLWTDAYPGLDNVEQDVALGALLVVREAGRIVAAASMGIFDDIDDAESWPPLRAPCELARLCVLPALQGRGIAREFLSLLIGEARQLGYGGIRLCAGVNQLAARRLYDRAGFVNTGERPYFGGRYCCYQMEL